MVYMVIQRLTIRSRQLQTMGVFIAHARLAHEDLLFLHLSNNHITLLNLYLYNFELTLHQRAYNDNRLPCTGAMLYRATRAYHAGHISNTV